METRKALPKFASLNNHGFLVIQNGMAQFHGYRRIKFLRHIIVLKYGILHLRQKVVNTFCAKTIQTKDYLTSKPAMRGKNREKKASWLLLGLRISQ